VGVLLSGPDDEAAARDGVGDARGGVQGFAVEHDQLGVLAGLDRAEAVGDVEGARRVDRQRRERGLAVEAVRDRDLGSFVEEAQRELAAVEAGLPSGYRFVWGGQFENQERAMRRLRLLVPAALLLIFLMLFSSLGSVKSALVILVNLPFALVGGICAIYALEIHLSVSASIGFIALFGVAVGNGLVLVSFFDQLRAQGSGVREAVFKACRLRVRPLMMTTLTTLLGLLPMLYATGSGSEIQKPLVAVIFGGLISSLALTLIVLPVLYTLVNREPHAEIKTTSETESGRMW